MDRQDTMPDPNEWIPQRARIAHGLRAEAGTEEATETAAPDATEATETDTGSPDGPQEPEKPAWEQRLDSLLDEPEEGPDAEAESTEEEAEAAASEEAEAATGEESAEEETAGAVDEGEEDPDAEADADTDDDLTVLRLPGRRPEDDDFEVKLTPAIVEELEAQGIDPQDFIERQNQQNNGYMRGNEVRQAKADIEAEREELDYIAQELQREPGEFIASRVHPSHYPDLIRRLVVQLDDESYDAVIDHMAKIERDPTARERARLDLEKQRVERRGEKLERSQRSDYVKDVRNQIIRLVPEEMDDARADEFFDFALYKLEDYARQNPGQRVQPERIPDLLRELGALAPYGLDEEANARTDDATASNPDQPKGSKGKDTERKRTGQDLRKRDESRKAAATAPAGASAGASPTKPPRGQSFEERMAWIEKHGTG